MTDAIAIGLAVSNAVCAITLAILGVTLHSIWKRKDTRDEQYLEADRGWKDATRDLESVRAELDQWKAKAAAQDRVILAARDLYAKAVSGQVVGLTDADLNAVIRGVHQDSVQDGAGSNAPATRADVPTAPEGPAGKKRVPHLGLVEDLE